MSQIPSIKILKTGFEATKSNCWENCFLRWITLICKCPTTISFTCLPFWLLTVRGHYFAGVLWWTMFHMLPITVCYRAEQHTKLCIPMLNVCPFKFKSTTTNYNLLTLPHIVFFQEEKNLINGGRMNVLCWKFALHKRITLIQFFFQTFRTLIWKKIHNLKLIKLT